MEIITGVERRRRWRPEEKRRVLAELEAPDATVAEVARRHDIRSRRRSAGILTPEISMCSAASAAT